MENIRTFIAIELPETFRDKLRSLLGEFKKSGADVKWVRPEGIHLTLKFLGSVSRESLEKVALAVKPAVERFDPFELKAQGVGCFPALHNPRVVWAGLGKQEESLSRLQREIELKAADLGFSPEERRFSPHLTLGRVRSPKGRDALIALIENKSKVDLASFLADRVAIFRSDLRPDGAVYTKLFEFLMKKTEN